MTYQLGVEGKGITAIRDLGEKEYEEYRKASACLLDFSGDQRLYAIVLLNYDDFLGTLKGYSQKYAENPSLVNWILMEKMFLDTNRHLLNLLSSIRTFLDHTQTKLTKRYGDKSCRVRQFKEACSKSYDNSFSYRFFSKLRNHSQHCGMPLGKMTLSSDENPPHSGNISHSLKATFSRDELLKFDSWGPQVQKEISQLPAEFDIVPHVIEMMKCLQRIVLVLNEQDLPELFKSAEFIEQLTNQVQTKEGIPCILKLLETDKGGNGEVNKMKIEIIHIPFHIVEVIKNIKKTIT